jgi:hypothetical protein
MFFSYQRGPELLHPGYFLYSFSTTQSLPAGRQSTGHLDESYRLSYRTIDKLVDECAAEVLDGLHLAQRKAKLVEEAVNLIGSDALGAAVWVFSISPIAHISTHALSTYPVPCSGALCHRRSP